MLIFTLHAILRPNLGLMQALAAQEALWAFCVRDRRRQTEGQGPRSPGPDVHGRAAQHGHGQPDRNGVRRKGRSCVWLGDGERGGGGGEEYFPPPTIPISFSLPHTYFHARIRARLPLPCLSLRLCLYPFRRLSLSGRALIGATALTGAARVTPPTTTTRPTRAGTVPERCNPTAATKTPTN